MTHPHSTPLPPSQNEEMTPIASVKKASATKAPAKEASAKKASAKKVPATKAFTANQSTCTVTLPLTEEAYSDLLTSQQQLVVFKDESSLLKVKDLE